MKLFNISLSILSLIIPSSSLAGQVLPTMYAREYCDLRKLGVIDDEARMAALTTAWVESLPDLPEVTIEGHKYTTDLVQAARAVTERCPEYLN